MDNETALEYFSEREGISKGQILEELACEAMGYRAWLNYYCTEMGWSHEQFIEKTDELIEIFESEMAIRLGRSN